MNGIDAQIVLVSPRGGADESADAMLDPTSFLRTSSPYHLVRGDALQLLDKTPDDSIDAWVTDPPYGIELKLGSISRARGGRSIAGDGKSEARRLWRRFVPECYRTARPDTLHVFFGTWKSPWMHSILSRSFVVKGCIVWDKRIIGLGHFLRPRWEMAYLCAKGKPPRLTTAPADVWQETRIRSPRHPCEKPVDLLRRAVRLVARPGDVVADCFAGIGSTGVAALAEGCRFLGCEIDARHARLANTRLRAAAAEQRGTDRAAA